MNKRFLIPSALCCIAAVMGGCVTDNSTHNTTNIEINKSSSRAASKADKSAKQYNGPKFDVDAVIKGMDASDFECGESSDAGIWVVAKVSIPADDKVPANELTLRGTLLAKQLIGEWIGTQASSTTSVSGEKTMSNDQVDVQQNIKVELKSKSEAFLRGVACYRQERKDGNFVAWYYATTKIADRSREFEAQLKAAPPGVVRATGLGMIVDGKITAAKREARQMALQAAVEQVMGTMVIGQSQLMDNDKAKSKLISQTAGNVKEYRIVKEAKDGANYVMIINAKVDEKNLLDNYAAMVRSMGNPGFLIKCQDPDLALALGDFFASLGFKVTTNPADCQFLIDANCKYNPVKDDHYGDGLQIDVLLRIFDVKSKQQILFSQNDPRLTSTYSGSYHQIRQVAAKRAFKTMKKELHEKLNKVVMDWVLNGREVKVTFKNAANTALDEVLAQSIADVPCAKFMTRSRNGNTLVLHCSYVGSSADFEEFLRERMKKDLPKGTALPKTKKIELNYLEFSF